MRARFPHWLEHAVGYEALLVSERRTLHATAAAALEPPAAASRSDDDLARALQLEQPPFDRARREAGEIARHLEASGAAARAGLWTALSARDAQHEGSLGSAADRATNTIRMVRGANAAVRVAVGLVAGHAWVAAQRLPEARAAFDDVLRLASELPAGAAAHARASAVSGLAALHQNRGEYGECCAIAAEALALAQKIGSEPLAAAAMNTLALGEWGRSRLEEALVWLDRSIEIRSRLGDPRLRTAGLINKSGIVSTMGRRDEARALFERAVEETGEGSDRRQRAMALQNLGHSRMSDGRFAEAHALMQEAATLARTIGDARTEALFASSRADILWVLGRGEEAIAIQTAAIDVHRSSGDRWSLALTLESIAPMLAATGRPTDAERAFAEALSLGESMSSAQVTVSVRANRAVAVASRGRRDDAEADLDAVRPDELARSSASARAVYTLACATVRGDLAAARRARREAEELGDYETALDARLLLARLLAEAEQLPESRSEAASLLRDAERIGADRIVQLVRPLARSG